MNTELTYKGRKIKTSKTHINGQIEGKCKNKRFNIDNTKISDATQLNWPPTNNPNVYEDNELIIHIFSPETPTPEKSQFEP